MAFQRKQGGGEGSRSPSINVVFSAKTGEKTYERGPISGLFKNDYNGPASHSGSIKNEYLVALRDFINNCIEADLPLRVSLMKPNLEGGKSKPQFKKPNPFKKAAEPAQEPDEQEEDPFAE